jgi:GAF domain-containing protein/HAMP domain-containing protein
MLPTTTAQKHKSARPNSGSEVVLFRWSAWFYAFFAAVLTITFAIPAFRSGSNAHQTQHMLVLAVVFGLLLGITIITAILKQSLTSRLLVLSFAIHISLIILSALVEAAGIVAGLVALLTALIMGYLSANLKRRDLALFAGLFAAIITAFTSYFSPYTQIVIPATDAALFIMLGFQVVLYAFFLLSGLGRASLRIKLLTAALALAIIPLVVFSLIQTRYTENILRNQNYENIRLAASQTAVKVDDYLINNISSTNVGARNIILVAFLQMDDQQRNEALTELKSAVEQILFKDVYGSIDSVALIDSTGIIIYDTILAGTGQWEGNQEHFLQTIQTGRSYSSPVLFDKEQHPYIVFTSPIRDKDLKFLGILRIRHRAEVFQYLISIHQGLLGQGSYPILVDENMIRLADASNENQLYHPITSLPEDRENELVLANRLPAQLLDSEAAYYLEAADAIRRFEENPFFSQDASSSGEAPYAGSIVRLRTAPWYVIYQQRQENLHILLNQTSRLTLFVATILVAVVSVISLFLARFFDRPILRLTNAAENIAAGNFVILAEENSGDEIGRLGSAFNQMARQMNSLITELEGRVRERTAELARQNDRLKLRSQQLHTVSDVARSIASTMELENLLSQVTTLISERFDFYHVGIFLIDSNGEFAVLRAANSEGGQHMLARGHKLRVGATGIVGYVCAAREARIATDVGKDSVYFNNPDLPLTRSEMALPLKIGGKVIGALDVQSIHSNAFTHEDIELFSVLADQVAIAITNNRLYAEANRSLAEIQELHRQYLRVEWKREITDRIFTSYRYTQEGVFPMLDAYLPETDQIYTTGEPLIRNENGTSQVFVPIILRGQPIGAIQLREPEQGNRVWTPDELGFAQALSDQIALALENARLLEQTTRRAERERKVLEITSKIRSTNDFNHIIQIAVEELQQALGTSRAQVIIHSLDDDLHSSINGSQNQPKV